MGNTLKMWRAVPKDDSWLIQDDKGHGIAAVNKTKNAETNARLIAASPYMLEALKAVEKLIGDEDLPDNGELSGAAICDLVRSAAALATGNDY
jgi:hypothetical protein